MADVRVTAEFGHFICPDLFSLTEIQAAKHHLVVLARMVKSHVEACCCFLSFSFFKRGHGEMNSQSYKKKVKSQHEVTAVPYTTCLGAKFRSEVWVTTVHPNTNLQDTSGNTVIWSSVYGRQVTFLHRKIEAEERKGYVTWGGVLGCWSEKCIICEQLLESNSTIKVLHLWNKVPNVSHQVWAIFTGSIHRIILTQAYNLTCCFMGIWALLGELCEQEDGLSSALPSALGCFV